MFQGMDYVYEVYKEQSFSKAAKNLYISQPSLSAAVKKAEQKMMRELNANPNSVTEMKKIWGYEKRKDGTLVITRYKGSNTKIEVPEKIGSSIVTEIGNKAFSVYAKD